jgi:hypothetical protein
MSRDEGRGRTSSRDSGRDSGRERGGRSGGTGFTYRARDSAAVARRAEGQTDDFDVYISRDVKLFKANDKDNNLRILPPTWDDPQHFGLDIWVHYGVGPDRQTYLCLHKMKNERCPICDERRKALDEGDEKYGKDLAPTRRVLVYIVDRDNEKEGVQAWAAPQTLDRDIVKVSVDKRSGEVLPIDHPEDGYDIYFEKKGSKDRTEYLGVQIARRSSPLGNDDWLQFAVDHPLPDQLMYYSEDHIAAAFGGGGVQRDAPRGGRDEPSRDRAPARGRDRDEPEAKPSRQAPPERSRSEDTTADLTWESVHAMTGDELDDLVESENLDKINPQDAKDDAELADWICEDMGLLKRVSTSRAQAEPRRTAREAEPPARRSRGDAEDARVTRETPRDEPTTKSRIEQMRARRSSGD